MNEGFWQSRWRENNIGFHEGQPNTLLLEHFHRFNLVEGDTVFVPLCGKTVDLDWLLSQGLHVIGIEFNQQAVVEVFARQNLVPTVTPIGSLLRYHSEFLTVFVGDIFDLNANCFGKINAIFDRAALVALPSDTRPKYARQIISLTNRAPQLLITFDYDQQLMDGPPFSVPGKQIREYYQRDYKIELLASQEISGHLAQRCHGHENTWFLE